MFTLYSIIKYLFILSLFFLNGITLHSQSSSIKLDSLVNYEPSNFTTYSIKDRFSDPYSSLFSNNAFYLNSSSIELGSTYDTAGVFYLSEKIGSLDYRPSISIPFSSYDNYTTKREI